MGESLNMQKLIDVLIKLRTASMQLSPNPTEEEVKALMNKYNMLFLGEKFNSIFSNELCHCLNEFFGIEVDNDKLNILLPPACKTLNMDCKPMVGLANLGKSTANGYSIILW